jgi:1,2-diacylglycerol 3-alpha-glucosyltransferase
LNIGIFTDTYLPQVNGVVTVVRNLKAALETRGHRVYIFTVQHPEAREEEGVFRVPSFQYPPQPEQRVGFFTDKHLVDLARPLDLDIIHSNTEFSLLLAAGIVRRQLEIPQIHTQHTYFKDYLDYVPMLLREVYFKKNLGSFMKRILSGQKCIIAPSQKIKIFLESTGLKCPVKVIPNGIDLSYFSLPGERDAEKLQAFRERFRIEKDDDLIVFAGRLGYEKNISVLLENFSKIYKQNGRAKLFLAGDGPDRGALQNYAFELRISSRVIFAGYLHWPEEISLAYGAAKLFMSASVSEVHPVTFIEALASGLPIVAAADISNAGMVQNGENGWAVEDPGKLWEKAAELLSSPELQARYGAKSLEISGLFTVERFADAMIAEYELYRKQAE